MVFNAIMQTAIGEFTSGASAHLAFKELHTERDLVGETAISWPGGSF